MESQIALPLPRTRYAHTQTHRLGQGTEVVVVGEDVLVQEVLDDHVCDVHDHLTGSSGREGRGWEGEMRSDQVSSCEEGQVSEGVDGVHSGVTGTQRWKQIPAQCLVRV